jgi:hypothetical protein
VAGKKAVYLNVYEKTANNEEDTAGLKNSNLERDWIKNIKIGADRNPPR